jgi:hypothetical protein
LAITLFEFSSAAEEFDQQNQLIQTARILFKHRQSFNQPMFRVMLFATNYKDHLSKGAFYGYNSASRSNISPFIDSLRYSGWI